MRSVKLRTERYCGAMRTGQRMLLVDTSKRYCSGTNLYSREVLAPCPWRDSVHFVCIGKDPFTVTRRLMDIAFYAVYCGRAPCTSSALVHVLQCDPKAYGHCILRRSLVGTPCTLSALVQVLSRVSRSLIPTGITPRVTPRVSPAFNPAARALRRTRIDGGL